MKAKYLLPMAVSVVLGAGAANAQRIVGTSGTGAPLMNTQAGINQAFMQRTAANGIPLATAGGRNTVFGRAGTAFGNQMLFDVNGNLLGTVNMGTTGFMPVAGVANVRTIPINPGLAPDGQPITRFPFGSAFPFDRSAFGARAAAIGNTPSTPIAPPRTTPVNPGVGPNGEPLTFFPMGARAGTGGFANPMMTGPVMGPVGSNPFTSMRVPGLTAFHRPIPFVARPAGMR